MKTRKHSRDANTNPENIQKTVLEYFKGRFGLDESSFKGFRFYLATKGRVYLGPRSAHGEVPIVSLGLLIARLSGQVKPTTNLFQAFGSEVKKNAVLLSKDQTITYAKGEDLNLSDEGISDVTDGYILLKYGKTPLGCGLLKNRTIKNMLPKAKRLEIKYL